MLDQADGRILDSYHVTSLPTYVLIGPDGKVIRDHKMAAPSLRVYKIEILRELLCTEPTATRSTPTGGR